MTAVFLDTVRTPSQVLDIVAGSISAFDEVNVATALHRLAKLQTPECGQASHKPVVHSEPFQQLITAIKRHLHRYEAQAISNTLWGEVTSNCQ